MRLMRPLGAVDHRLSAAWWILVMVPAVSTGCEKCGPRRLDKTGVVPVSSATASASVAAAVAASAPSAPSVSAAQPAARIDRLPSLSEAQADAVVRPGETRIELHAAGGDPKRALRYAPNPGPTVKLSARYDIAMMQSMSGETLAERAVPELIVDLDGRIEAGYTWHLRVAAARARARGDAEKPLAEEMAPVLAELAGKQGAWSIDPRGARVVAASAGRTPAEVLQLWSSIAETVRDMVPPLPEEPVGAGARWRASWRMLRGGIALLRTAEYELRRVAGAELSIAATVRERSIDSRAKDPALGAMADEVNLRAVAGASEGELRLELRAGEIVPRRAEITLDSNLDVEVSGPRVGGVALRSNVRLHQHILVLPFTP